MMSARVALLKNESGNAAVEMALSIPMLFALMFGAFELGSYFYAEHKVVKAVRDGARFASRQPFSEYPSCAPSTAVVDNTRNVTRTGRVTGGAPRLTYWSNPATISVTAACFTTNADSSVTYGGIYSGRSDGAPVVTVAAAVPYTPILGQLGLLSATLTLNARSQAAVNGI